MLSKIRKAVLHPDKAWRSALRTFEQTFLWERYCAQLREPKVMGPVTNDDETYGAIVQELQQGGYDVCNYRIDVADFQHYLERAEYRRFPAYYGGGRAAHSLAKSLEHCLAARLLDLTPDDVYIDIANASSPAPDIYGRLYRCAVYRQDLTFPLGLHGNVIGGDAAELPLPDGFASKMALHCSFEHFEKDSDIRFIREAGRVLRPGGKLCIVPLYLSTHYAIQTDPVVLPRGGVDFDAAAVLHCVKGYRNRHGRFYSVPQLTARVRSRLGELRLRIYVVENAKEVHPSCDLKFVALFEKGGPLGRCARPS